MATVNLGKVVPEKGVDYFTDADIAEIQQGMQTAINADNKVNSDYISDINQTNKFVTAQDKMNWNAKQDALIAGDNIVIEGNTISSTGGGSGSGVQELSSDDVDELDCGWYYVYTTDVPTGVDITQFKAGGSITCNLNTMFLRLYTNTSIKYSYQQRRKKVCNILWV